MTKKQIIGLSILVGVVSIGSSVLLSSWLLTNSLTDWTDAMEARVRAIVAEGAKTTTSTVTETQSPVITINGTKTDLSMSTELAARPSPLAHLVKKSVDIGQAIALTNDGWFVSVQTIWTDPLALADVQLIMSGKNYPIEKALKDNSTGLVYLKISARDLPIASISNDTGERGQLVFLNPSERWYIESISEPHWFEAGTKPSEYATRRLLVSGGDVASWKGAALWDEQGKLIGLLNEHTKEGWLAIPGRFVGTGFSNVLSAGLIRRASVNASLVTDATGKQELKKAAKPLMDGDVIEQIDRDILDGSKDVGELLFDYRPGSTVTIRGLRNNKEFSTDVKLSSVTSTEVLK